MGNHPKRWGGGGGGQTFGGFLELLNSDFSFSDYYPASDVPSTSE